MFGIFKKWLHHLQWPHHLQLKRLSYWNPGDSYINSLMSCQLDMLQNRSRDVVGKNLFASNLLDAIFANRISSGIKPQPKIIDSSLKKKLWNLWLSWTDEADFAGVSGVDDTPYGC
jgi:hypothetical protein